VYVCMCMGVCVYNVCVGVCVCGGVCVWVCVCMCVSQQMLPIARKTVANLCSNEQCFVIISAKTTHKNQSVSSFVRPANQL
jgi:hypothetical protein